MTVNELFGIVQQKDHEVIFSELKENDAISAEVLGKCYITIPPELPVVDEIELLSHELGHCEYAGFYSRLTPMNTRQRVEYRAKKWQFLKLIPLGALREAIKRGVTAPWDLAELFGVSEPFLCSACEYYQKACGSIIEEAM